VVFLPDGWLCLRRCYGPIFSREKQRQAIAIRGQGEICQSRGSPAAPPLPTGITPYFKCKPAAHGSTCRTTSESTSGFRRWATWPGRSRPCSLDLPLGKPWFAGSKLDNRAALKFRGLVLGSACLEAEANQRAQRKEVEHADYPVVIIIRALSKLHLWTRKQVSRVKGG